MNEVTAHRSSLPVFDHTAGPPRQRLIDDVADLGECKAGDVVSLHGSEEVVSLTEEGASEVNGRALENASENDDTAVREARQARLHSPSRHVDAAPGHLRVAFGDSHSGFGVDTSLVEV